MTLQSRGSITPSSKVNQISATPAFCANCKIDSFSTDVAELLDRVSREYFRVSRQLSGAGIDTGVRG